MTKEGHTMHVHLQMGKALLRSMKHDDLDRVMHVEKACFPQNLLEDEIVVYLTIPGHVAAVVEYEGEIVAFMLCRKDHVVFHLDDIAVLPSHQGKGLGKMMLRWLQKEFATLKCKHLCLCVRFDNPAKKLYEDFGFQKYGYEEDAYEPGGHAILMHYSPGVAAGDLPRHLPL
jgi:ribosomal protein S18 acetylase RimI-like enzyme